MIMIADISLQQLNISLRAVPEIILGGHIFSDPSTPRTHMESEPPPDPQDSSVNETPQPQDT